MKGEWLNTEKVIHEEMAKPCIKLRYCPYGQLVEEFPLRPDGEHTKLSCCLENNGGLMQFGHDCPVHYHAEYLQVTKDGKGVLAPVLGDI